MANYQASDDAVSFTKGNIYYRLKMTAADGSIKYSNIIRIKGDKNALFVKNIFMQGANTLMIETDGMDVKEMWVNVYMADGKELFRQKYQYGNQQINMAMYPVGSYFIKVVDANNKFQFIKQVSK